MEVKQRNEIARMVKMSLALGDSLTMTFRKVNQRFHSISYEEFIDYLRKRNDGVFEHLVFTETAEDIRKVGRKLTDSFKNTPVNINNADLAYNFVSELFKMANKIYEESALVMNEG